MAYLKKTRTVARISILRSTACVVVVVGLSHPGGVSASSAKDLPDFGDDLLAPYGNVALVANGQVFCGGTKIYGPWILTARHCAEHEKVFIVSKTTSFDPSAPTLPVTAVVAKYVHPSADLALLNTGEIEAGDMNVPFNYSPGRDYFQGGYDIWRPKSESNPSTKVLRAYEGKIDTWDHVDMYGGPAVKSVRSSPFTVIPCAGTWGSAYRNASGSIVGVLSVGDCETYVTVTRTAIQDDWMSGVMRPKP